MHDQDKIIINKMRVVSITCAALGIALVCIVQFQLLLGLKDLSSFGKSFIPMAEETALLFILMSIASILFNTIPTNKIARNAILLICFFTSLLSFVTLIDIGTNYEWNLSDIIELESSVVNGIVTGRMSSITAICFIIASISQLLILKNIQQLAAYLSVIVICVSYIIIVGYAYGVPFFYSSGYIPMSWPTSISFFILSIGLLFTAGKDCSPISNFIGNSTRALMMRKLMPVVFIILLVQNVSHLVYVNNETVTSAFLSGLIDIIKMIVIGLVISIVSKRVGNTIDTIISELTLFKSKVNQLSQAVENSPVTIVITDLAGNIIYANNKFVEVTGYNKEEVIGHNPRILKSGHTSDEEYKELWESVTHGKSWKGEFQNKHKNGSFYWESAAIYPIKNSQDEVIQFLAIKEDITEQKKASAKLKNIAWQQSHEIRGPLTSIMGIIGVINLSNSAEEKMSLLASLDEAAKKLDLAIRSIVYETHN